MSEIEPVTDAQLRAMWRSNGGNFHGPNIETGTMPESKLLPLLREIMNRQCDALESLQSENADLRRQLEDATGLLTDEQLRTLRLRRAVAAIKGEK